MSKIPLPEVPIGEITVFRPFTVPGLFVYRHFQAVQLIQLPDYAGGDLVQEQRREMLERAAELHRPLTALAIFLTVVALEDLFRELGQRLADLSDLSAFFPSIKGLSQGTIPPSPAKPTARLDRDPISLLDLAALNALYQNCLGVTPVDSALAPRINDLVLLRHTVAHHGAIIRNIDVSRFQYYAVQPGHLINPPVGFVRETAGFIYEVGREFERTVQKRVFSVVLKSLAPEWYQNPPELVVHLIELFNFLGKLLTDDDPLILPNDPSQIEAYLVERGARGRAKLVDLCVQDLRATYGP